ncbi:carboxypeptidase-like regulatory domain-containing protein [Granulicella tundricola]|uniref:Carboxypeptidase regulatory-like domain-containing protein n=1 Tax=Granulicella tundricola (strain ATCC BAA-1859 / DSM 23138 / MP5ACTX9) TaxID=1198114 RepID=E8WX83_GRATM|nr:carboxypeptidase-like regulatory domain-containing protein [Granulicella tundricola]ADW69725.1 hypothetical protein AciX9_2701 [Granulicella tundricola MP5ACTX9]
MSRFIGLDELAARASVLSRGAVASLFLAATLCLGIAPSHAQTVQLSRTELPDSPGHLRDLELQATAAQQTPNAPQTGTASIRGVVLDVNQGIVPDAKLTLTEHGVSGDRTAISGPDGIFTFADLPAGRYNFIVTSAGLETFVSSEITLKEGQHYEEPKIALPIATASSDVTVRVTERELAEEQIKAEMQQRVLGIFPNFYSSFIWDAAPLEPKQKFEMALRARSDPFVFLVTGIVAGVQQARDKPSAWGQDLPGYAQRYGAAFTTGTVSRFFGSAIYPVVFHQDPRYFYKGSGSVSSRAWYAMTRSVVARGDNGKWQPNYSHILGGMTAGAISNLYHPASSRGAALTFENAGLGIGFTAAGNLVREFVLRGVTHKVPTYEQGDKSSGKSAIK